MAIVDVVKYDAASEQVVWRFPSDNLRIGTQLIVRPGQEAIFVYRGKVADCFEEGAYTLNTGNIPLLTGLLGLPFGGDTPFQAEVWFVNKLSKLDIKWGTSSPILVEDPKYGIVLQVRAFGQYGFRVSEPALLLNTLVGVQPNLSDADISRYFKGKVMSSVGTIIGNLFNNDVSFLNIASQLEEVSLEAQHKIADEYKKYGIQIENFYFHSINVPEDDPSYLRLKQIKEKSAELNVIGRDIYQFDKRMEVLKTAAGNEGTAGEVMSTGLGAGLGLGMGAMMGGAMGQQMGQMSQNMNSPTPPPIQRTAHYYLYIAGEQHGPYDQGSIAQMIMNGSISDDAMIWKEGLPEWVKLSEMPEFQTATGSPPPPPPKPTG